MVTRRMQSGMMFTVKGMLEMVSNPLQQELATIWSRKAARSLCRCTPQEEEHQYTSCCYGIEERQAWLRKHA